MLNLKRFAIFSLKDIDEKVDLLQGSYSYRLNFIKEVLKSKGYGFKVVKGSYKGTLETSILVVCDDDAKLEWVRQTAFNDGQESILVVDESRRASLEFNPNRDIKYNNAQVENIGMFQSITPVQATELDSWTLDESESQYYGVL
jgi:ABC-type uncharacterized transport system permease subunit